MSLSIDLLPLHPAYLMLAWLIIVAPWGWESGGCQQGFARLRWIFIVFVPWSVRATVTCVETGWFQEAKNGFGTPPLRPHVHSHVYSTCHMIQASVFTSLFFLLTLILSGIQYYLEALGNLWNGNEIPKSNLHFHDKLHWHSVLFPDSTEEARIQVETGGGIVQNVGFISLLFFFKMLSFILL